MNTRNIYESVHQKCCTVIESSSEAEAALADIHNSLHEMSFWYTVYTQPHCRELLPRISEQTQISLYLAASGLYRQSCASLRLALELAIGYVSFSTNIFGYKEWTNGNRDLIWSEMVDGEKGVFSKRFVDAFMPSLNEHERGRLESIKKETKSNYRFLSEHVHGGANTFDVSQALIEYKKDNLDEVIRIANRTIRDFHILMAIRYLDEINATEVDALSYHISDYVESFPTLRAKIGGRGND